MATSTVPGQDACCQQRFFHPIFQSAGMFLGELSCFLPAVFIAVWKMLQGLTQKREGSAHGPNEPEAATSLGHRLKVGTLFLAPALCDSLGTTLLNVGLFFTYASAYQMLRGTIVLFTGVFTMSILKRKLRSNHWAGMFIITFGAFLVGIASIISCNPDGTDTVPTPGGIVDCSSKGSGSDKKATSLRLLGDILVFAAQVVAALQFIVEEKFLSKYSVPPHIAVGLEGFWGLIICAVSFPLLGMLRQSNGEPIDDFSVAWGNFMDFPTLKTFTIMSIVSIAFFNFFGLTVTQNLSGSSRATVDACRTILVWIYSSAAGWEEICFRRLLLQVSGFVFLVVGTALYNNLLTFMKPKKAPDALEQPLIPEKPSPDGVAVPINPAKRGWMGTMARSLRLGSSLGLISSLSSQSLASQGDEAPATPVSYTARATFGDGSDDERGRSNEQNGYGSSDGSTPGKDGGLLEGSF